jgi:hypothetical protein
MNEKHKRLKMLLLFRADRIAIKDKYRDSILIILARFFTIHFILFLLFASL